MGLFGRIQIGIINYLLMCKPFEYEYRLAEYECDFGTFTI
jgi:hypothetical protein